MTEGFDAYFDRFTNTAFRYESLAAYAVEQEAELIDAWRHGRPRPERSVRTSPWLRRVAVTTAAGKEWTRVRVVDDPLPEYLRYELPAYVESQAAGDQTFLVDRALAVQVPDFWLFDGGAEHATALVMHYDIAGAFVAFEAIDNRSELAELDLIRRTLLQRATPLNVWLASHGGVRG